MLTALIISPLAPDVLASSPSRPLWPGSPSWTASAGKPRCHLQTKLGLLWGTKPKRPLLLWDTSTTTLQPVAISSSTREIKFWANNWELTPRDRRPKRGRVRTLNGKLSRQHSSHHTERFQSWIWSFGRQVRGCSQAPWPLVRTLIYTPIKWVL